MSISSVVTSEVVALRPWVLDQVSSTYATISSLTDYTKTSDLVTALSTNYTLTSALTSTYLTKASASSTYATTGSLTAYLTKASASSTYVPLSSQAPVYSRIETIDATGYPAFYNFSIPIEKTTQIYYVPIFNDLNISCELSNLTFTNNTASWDTWLKVFAPGTTVGLPPTSTVQYVTTPNLSTTTYNELLQISWTAWKEGSATMVQAHLYNRRTDMPAPTLAEMRTYHYGDPNIVESPASWFVFDAGTKTITGYNYVAGRKNVVIPWEIGGVPVESIGDMYSSQITNVVAGRSVLSIGSNAFNSCGSLTSVTLPAATSIGSSAFYGCTLLTSVTLPAATSIGSSAFDSCTSLSSVSLPAAASIGDYAFADCASLTNVNLPAATSIGNSAFYGCDSLTSVTLPVATSIGYNVFYGCTLLSSVYFGNATPTEWQDMFTDVPGPVTIYYLAGAQAWSGVTTWCGMPTAPYTP